MVLLAGWLLGEDFFQRHSLRIFIDTADMDVYFRESEWVLRPGRLPFRDSFSEYPLLANLVFGVVRVISAKLPLFADAQKSFLLWWAGLAGAGYGFMAVKLAGEGKLPLAIWLSPAVLYFSLFRFDLYPAIASMFALWSLREDRFVRAALWLGICIAFKGYAAAVLPALGIYLIGRVGFRRAAALCALAVAPMLASLLAVWMYAGLDGMLMPFRFHAARTYNDETIYLAVNTLLEGRATEVLDGMLRARVPVMIQVGFALLAAALRPKTFEDLVHAFLVAIAGFVTALVFHSPQFILWIVAVAVFAKNRFPLWVALALGWLTYVYFPVLFDMYRNVEPWPNSRIRYDLSILIMVVLQLAAMFRPRALEKAA